MMSIPPKVRSPFVWSLTKRQVCSLTLIITLLCSSCLIAGYSYAASIGAQKYPTSYMEGGPTGDYDYTIYTFQNDTGTYYAAKDQYGHNQYTSSNVNTLIDSVKGVASNGDSIYLGSGVAGFSTPAYCVVATAGETITAGQLVIFNAVNSAVLANASSEAECAYGFVYLAACGASSSAKVFVVQNVVPTFYTNSGYSFSGTAQLWLSKTDGVITETALSDSGDMLVKVGRAMNATTMMFSCPNGFYMEHP